MHDCEKLRESIWEAVEKGEIAGGLLSQLGECETCRRELARAQSAMLGFESIRSADAPDCSDAMMAGIGGATHRGRPAWAYALGLALVFVIAAVLIGLQRPRVAPPGANVAMGKSHQSTAHRTPAAKDLGKNRLKKHVGESDRVANTASERHGRRTAWTPPHSARHRPGGLHTPMPLPGDGPKALAAVRGQPEHHDTPTAANPDQDKQRIMIIVTNDFTSQDDQSDVALDYGYTHTNPKTGEVTNCSVKRSGESVEIYMNVKPGTKKGPGEGRLYHENEINA